MIPPADSSSSTQPNLVEAAALLSLVHSLTDNPFDTSGWETLLSGLLLQACAKEELYSAISELTSATLKLSTHTCHLMAVAARVIALRTDVPYAAISSSIKLAFEASMVSLFHHVLDVIHDNHTPQQRRWMLCFLAAQQGLTTYSTAMLEYSEEELADFMIVDIT